MQTKLLEVRDRLTMIPVMATLMVPTEDVTPNQERNWSPQLVTEVQFLHATERRFLRHCGYTNPDHPPVMLTHLAGGHKAECDPYAWGDRTWQAAHAHIERHFHELDHGAVVDVRVILGEASEPAPAELGR